MQRVSCYAECETYQITKPAPRTMQSRRLRANSLYRGTRKPPIRTALLDPRKDISIAAPQSPGDQNSPNFKLYLSINIRRILFTYANLSSWLTSKAQRSPSTGTFCFACEDLHPPHAATYGLNRLLTLPTKPYREEKAYADHQNAGSRSPAPSASFGSSKSSTSNTTSRSSSATKPAAQALS
jgi:hypothetical protein